MSEDIVHLTPESLDRARELGTEMVGDRVIRPLTGDAVFYEDYDSFRTGHRARWERSWRFEQHWQPQIFALASLEAARNGIAAMDQASYWRLCHGMIFTPIKDALWKQWEEQVNLEECYREALLRANAASEHRRAGLGRNFLVSNSFPRWSEPLNS